MRTTLAIALSAALTTIAAAQPATHQGTITGVQPRLGTSPNQPAAPSLFQLGEDGKPKPVVGPADLAALKINPEVSEEQLAAMRPAINDWLDRLDRTSTENIDLLVELRTSALKNFDMKDSPALMFVNDSVNMLRGAGAATDYLQRAGDLSDSQASMNRRIVNDFQRANMMYLGEQAAKQHADDMNAQIKVVTEGNYYEALRDSFWVYDRIVAALASHPDLITKAIGEAGAEAVASLDKLGAADTEARTAAVEKLLASLDYEQQKALAEAALAAAPLRSGEH